MHPRALRSAVPSTTPVGFRPAYNLFRSTRSADLLCAVPEDYPVPAFIKGQGWAFAGKLAEPSAAPLGFEWTGAGAVVPPDRLLSVPRPSGPGRRARRVRP